MLYRFKGKRGALLAGLLAGTSFLINSASAQECEVKIGVIGPMTGGGSSWGLAEKAGTEFEAAWVNEQGGLQVGDKKCKVSVVSSDALGTAAGGASASNFLASKGVHVTNGPVTSPEVTGFKPVAKRNGQINFAPSFANDVIGPDFPLAFHQVQGPTVWAPLVIKNVHDRFKFDKAVVLGPNDQGGTDAGNVLAKSYTDAGVKTSTEWYQRGTTNFSPIVARLMSIDPNLVEIGPMPPGEAAILVKQLTEAGYDGVFGRLGSGGSVILANSGGAEAQKGFFAIEHVPTHDPGILKLKADFERLMKTKPPENALLYNAQITAEQILRAISLAGTDQDPEKIAAELRKMTPESRYLGRAGWRGKAQYGVNQEFTFPIGLDIIVDGKKQPQVRLEIPAEQP
jgi:branched-chain amino acid transport system substrate-binding protein